LSPLQALHSSTLGAPRLLSPRYRERAGKLEAGRYADIRVVPGDPIQDISLLQRPSRYDSIFKGGEPILRTPPAPRKRKRHARTNTFLAGLYVYDEEEGRGRFIQE